MLFPDPFSRRRAPVTPKASRQSRFIDVTIAWPLDTDTVSGNCMLERGEAKESCLEAENYRCTRLPDDKRTKMLGTHSQYPSSINSK